MSAAQVLAPYRQFLLRPFEDVARDLESFAALLLKWNQTQNLVSRETVHEIWPRHIADSLQALKFLRESDHHLVDLGSGGGFPVIPLSIASGTSRLFTLVEPIAKKASFLRTVSRELDLGLQVEARRSAELDPGNLGRIDVITSRALAPLPDLLGLAAPFFGPTTRAILHKGREHVDEVAESRAAWQFDVLVHASDRDPGGVLLEISNLRLK